MTFLLCASEFVDEISQKMHFVALSELWANCGKMAFRSKILWACMEEICQLRDDAT